MFRHCHSSFCRTIDDESIAMLKTRLRKVPEGSKEKIANSGGGDDDDNDDDDGGQSA